MALNKELSDLTCALSELAHQMCEDRKERQQAGTGFRCHDELATKLDIERLIKIMTEAEKKLIADAKEHNAQLRKLIADTFGQQALVNALKAKITELEAVIAAGGPLSQELIDLFAEGKALIQQLDDGIPELVGTPPAVAVLTQAQIDALATAGLALTQAQITANTAGTGPTLTIEQATALASAGIPVTPAPAP